MYVRPGWQSVTFDIYPFKGLTDSTSAIDSTKRLVSEITFLCLEWDVKLCSLIHVNDRYLCRL